MAKRTIVALPAATLAAAAFAASAPASPGTRQYDNPVPREKPPAAAVVQEPGGGSLPFTGLEIGLIVAGGCGAAGAGLVLRRATRGRRE